MKNANVLAGSVAGRIMTNMPLQHGVQMVKSEKPMSMGDRQKNAEKQGSKFNKAGEMTTDPTPQQKADFERRFPTSRTK